MIHLLRFSAVLIAFVASVAGITWTTASAERHIGTREFSEREAAGAMLDALLARESALRGFAESGSEGFLQPYDEATAALAAAADRARAYAGGRAREDRRDRRAGADRRALGRDRQRRRDPDPERAPDLGCLGRFPQRPDRELREAERQAGRADRGRQRRTSRRRGRARGPPDRPAQRRVRGRWRAAFEPDAPARDAAAARGRAVPRVPARVRRDAPGDGERGRGACTRQAAPRAVACGLGDRRPDPEQQPEPARGGDAGDAGQPDRREARRLLAQLVPRGAARPDACAGDRQRAAAHLRSLQPARAHDVRPLTRRRRGDRLGARRARAAAERIRAGPDRPVGQPGRSGARQPPQPRRRRGSRRHRRADRPAERRAASARTSSAWSRRRPGRICRSPRCSATSTTSSRSTTSTGTRRATRRWRRRAPRSARRSARATSPAATAARSS